LVEHPEQAAVLRPLSGFLARMVAGWFVWSGGSAGGATPISLRAIQLTNSMADLEYAIKTHETFKRWFAGWLKFHIAISFILYLLLGLHVWSGIYFGLRWFE
jgi:hypothetical protein